MLPTFSCVVYLTNFMVKYAALAYREILTFEVQILLSSWKNIHQENNFSLFEDWQEEQWSSKCIIYECIYVLTSEK